MELKRVGENMLDVFTGKGWTQWSRFEVSFNHNRLNLKLIKGSPMSKADFRQLYEDLNK